MIILAAGLFYLPITGVAVLACAGAAAALGHAPRMARKLLYLARLCFWVLGLGGLALAIASTTTFPDWNHDFWAAQMAMVACFLCSGALLCELHEQEPAGAGPAGRGSRARPFAFGALLLALFLVAPTSMLLDPESYAAPRATGRPFENLVELARYGLGDGMPGWLVPRERAELEQGFASISRELTVPMGTTWIAAWLWTAFVAVTCFAQYQRQRLSRARLQLVCPLTVGLVLILGQTSTPAHALLDFRVFNPFHARSSVIWEPVAQVFTSYGPLLLVALVATLVLLACQSIRARASTARVEPVSSPAA